MEAWRGPQGGAADDAVANAQTQGAMSFQHLQLVEVPAPDRAAHSLFLSQGLPIVFSPPVFDAAVEKEQNLCFAFPSHRALWPLGPQCQSRRLEVGVCLASAGGMRGGWAEGPGGPG